MSQPAPRAAWARGAHAARGEGLRPRQVSAAEGDGRPLPESEMTRVDREGKEQEGKRIARGEERTRKGNVGYRKEQGGKEGGGEKGEESEGMGRRRDK